MAERELLSDQNRNSKENKKEEKHAVADGVKEWCNTLGSKVKPHATCNTKDKLGWGLISRFYLAKALEGWKRR
jgi:hypothetical protein